MAVTRFIDIKIRSKSAERNVDSLDRKMKDLGKTADSSLFKLSKIAKSVGAALVAAKIAETLTNAAQAAAQFNASISNLSAITGAVGKDLEFLRKTALEFGATTTLSATQAAEALKLVASAKPDLLETGEALKEVTKQAIILAEAAGVDLATAAKTVGSTLNQFSADSKEAARFINVLAAGAKFGASEIEDTALALQKAGVAASSAKISFEETNAAIQVLAAVSIKGAEAGTTLRNIFLKLNNDVDKNLRPSVVGLRQALINLNNKNLESTDILKKFGLENIIAAQTLLDNVDSLDQLTGKLTGTNTAIEQATTNMNNLAGDVKALGSAFETLQINIGTLADEDLRLLTQSLTTLLQAINGDQDALKEWGDIIDTASIAAQSLGAVIGAKLAVSIGTATVSALAYIRAQTAATITTNAFGVVTARTTVLMNTMTLATRGAATALALIGGPVGVAFLAATAIFLFVDAAESAEEKSSRLSDEIDGLTASFIGLTAAQRNTEISRINTDFRTLSDQLVIANDQLVKVREGVFFKGKTSIISGLEDEVNSLNKELDELAVRRQAIFAGGLPSITGTTEDGQPTAGGTTEPPKAAVKKDSSFIQGLKLETEALQNELRVRQLIRSGIFTEEEGAISLNAENQRLRQQARFDIEIEKLGTDEEARNELTAAFNEQQLLNEQLFQAALTEIDDQESQNRIDILKKEQQERQQAASLAINSAVSLGVALLKNSITNNAKSEKEKKRARKKGVIIDTAAGIARAFAENNFFVALGLSSVIAANGLAQISAINSASGTPSAPGGAGGTSAGQLTGPTPTAQDTTPQTRVIDIRIDDNALLTGSAFKDALSSVLESDSDIAINITNAQDEAARIGG